MDTARPDPDDVVYRVEFTGTLDRHAIESLRLELARLARRYDLTVQHFRVDAVTD